MFVIRMLDGEEIHVTGTDRLVIADSGVLTVHCSPTAWRSVTHRVKRGIVGNP